MSYPAPADDATRFDLFVATLTDALESAPLSLASVAWHDEEAPGSQLESGGVLYDLDLSQGGSVTPHAGGVFEVDRPLGLVLLRGRNELETSDVQLDAMRDFAEDVRGVLWDRLDLHLRDEPGISVGPTRAGDAIEARFSLRARYELSVDDDEEIQP